MKTYITIFLILSLTSRVKATEQRPDKLIYGDLTLNLKTGWGHPSPLQTYFYQNNIAYPFTGNSTANYRGHIAIWTIQNDRFYLKALDVKDKTYKPEDYGVKAKNSSSNLPNLVFADWFSGILECDKVDPNDRWNTISTFYFQIKRGEIVSKGEVTKNDFDRISRISEKDTSDKELMTKYKLLYLNQNYIGYYFRLNQNDLILYKNRECHLNTSSARLSPLYSYYSNEHLNWLYNWENLEKSGAPHCEWKISNDSLILTGVQLYKGLAIDSIEKETIELSSLFPAKEYNRQVFADWVSGLHLIIYGVDTTYDFGFKTFHAKEYTYCRLLNGIVTETYTVSASDAKKEDLDPRLKQLMKEY